jgi:hypothetical protein
LLTVIRDALAGLPVACSRVVELCDLEGLPTADAAEALHISVRQLFRYRADAVAAIAGEINRVLSRRDMVPVSGEAGGFEAGLGLMLLARGDPAAYPQAVRCFESALALDERNAAAHAGLATALLQLAAESMGDPVHLHRRARAHLAESLRLAGELSPAARFAM